MTKSSTFGIATSTDLCAIIEACGKNGVAKLQVDGMLIEFEATQPKKPAWEGTILNPYEYGTGVETAPEIPDNEDEEPVDEYTQAYLDDLKLTDPVEYERITLRGED